MSTPHLTAIVAMAANRAIGHQGSLPWHYPEDLKFFKQTTSGHPILMGRNTYESIGRPLPNRHNIVLSKTLPPTPGITIIQDLDQLASAAAEADRIFVIGGAQLYLSLLPHCQDLYLTFINETHHGDTFFPAFEQDFPHLEILHSSPPLEFRYYRRSTQTQPGS
jgi:dihydrofolate reductase